MTKDPRIREQAQEGVNRMEQFQGYILQWAGSGPYQVKGMEDRALFKEVFPPEQPDAKNVQWTKVTKGIGSWDIDLGEAITNADNCVAYMRTRVWSPVAKEARLELGSDDGNKVWLNGQIIQAIDTNRGLTARQDIVKIKLKEGWNDLLIKIINASGGWGFGCRIRQSDGGELEGLKFEAE
jgi:hypothetical protein